MSFVRARETEITKTEMGHSALFMVTAAQHMDQFIEAVRTSFSDDEIREMAQIHNVEYRQLPSVLVNRYVEHQTGLINASLKMLKASAAVSCGGYVDQRYRNAITQSQQAKLTQQQRLLSPAGQEFLGFTPQPSLNATTEAVTQLSGQTASMTVEQAACHPYIEARNSSSSDGAVNGDL
jgi:hypothetical protein